jgi:hypothetical protein
LNRQDAKVATNGGVLEPSAELDELAHRVIGAAIEVLEPNAEHRSAEGERVGETRLDLLVNDSLVVIWASSSTSVST